MNDASTPVILTYAPPTERSRTADRWRWLTFFLLLPALVVPFVNFTFESSPLDAAKLLWPIPPFPFQFSDDLLLCLLGMGFFVAFPLGGWMLRRLLHPAPPGRIERIGGWAMAMVWLALVAAMLAIVARNQIYSVQWPPDRTAVLIGSMLLGGFGIAALGIWQAIRDRGNSRLAIQTLMTSAYLANAWICLIGFHEDPELGYWLTLPPAGILLVGLIRRSFRRYNAL